MKNKSERLSPEQIQNWRRVLCTMIGPYALMMPEDEIQRFRDKMQNDINQREISNLNCEL